jgi:tRNA (guanine-N7-)-methyltransferase
VSPRQRSAIDRLWAEFGLEVGSSPLDVDALFGRSAPLVLEIGFGMGDATAVMAAADPGRNLLAVDVHTPGFGTLLNHVEGLGLTNVRVADGDAVRLLRECLAPGSVDEVRIFFPDPWPKQKHHKRRLVDVEFLALLGSRVRPGGLLRLATDWQHYADRMATALETSPLFETVPDAGRGDRPITRFEQGGIDAGRRITDLVARRIG